MMKALILTLLVFLASCGHPKSEVSRVLIGKSSIPGQYEAVEVSREGSWSPVYRYEVVKQPDHYYLVYWVTNRIGDTFPDKVEVTKEIHDSTVLETVK